MPEFLNTIRAIAIDLDGTLLDTIGDLANSANATLQQLSMGTLDHELLKSFVGKGRAMHLRRAMAASLLRDPTHEEFEHAFAIYTEHYRAHLNDTTTAYPGVREGLAAFRARGLGLACVTNKGRAFTQLILAAQEMSFDFLVCGDDLPTNKPDPAMLHHAAKQFGVAPHELLMIGDSANDALAARAAGCPLALVDYGYTEGLNLSDIPNDVIIHSFTDLLPYL